MVATTDLDDAGKRRLPLMDVFRVAHATSHSADPSLAYLQGLGQGAGLSPPVMRKLLLEDVNRVLAATSLETAYAKSRDLDPKLAEEPLPPRVRGSILNYGLRDLLSLPDTQLAHKLLEKWIEDSLKRHEPRLRKVKVAIGGDIDPGQNIIPCLLTAVAGRDPYSFTLDIVAEIDLSGGSIHTKYAR